MAVPFHRLKVCGDILFAARGGSVHTFRVADGTHIAAWRAPKPKSNEEAKDSKDKKAEIVPPAEAGGEDIPPSKRRRLDEAAGVAETSPEQQTGEHNGNGAASNGQKPKQSKSSNNNNNKAAKKGPKDPAKAQASALRTADLPVVSILEVTADGGHVVVILGHDKTVRVLAHDGQGHLTQLSERVMPKRPCAVAFTADGQTILSGDKFGDVYAVPLIEPAKAEKTPDDAAREASAPPSAAAVVAPLRLEANQFTVHTKGNRQALENQRRQKELALQQQKKDHEPSGDYQLLLGHVSMLTAVIVAEGISKDDQGRPSTRRRRPLILTADRDEHIRVTRGVVASGSSAQSQTHVIETFCLGHTSFVSRLCVPRSRPDRLVSGGGDGELRVWDFWPEGRLVGRADLASLVAAVLGAAPPKVALSGLYALGGRRAGDPDAMTDSDDGGSADAFLVAVCERVPALFFFQLAADGAALAHTQTLRLPAGQLPLDVAEVAASGALVVATAPADDSSAAEGDAPSTLLTLVGAKDDGAAGHLTWSAAAASSFASLPPPTGDDDREDRVALRQLLLRSTESLRKDNEGEE